MHDEAEARVQARDFAQHWYSTYCWSNSLGVSCIQIISAQQEKTEQIGSSASGLVMPKQSEHMLRNVHACMHACMHAFWPLTPSLG